MGNERSWIDRFFGTGIVFSLVTVGIAFWGIFQANTRAGQAQSQLQDQATLRNELKEQLKITDTALSELKGRLAKLETKLTVTKVEADGATLQANVARLQMEYDKPEERALLGDFGLKAGTRHRTFAEMLNEHPGDPAAIESLPPPPTLPENLDFLNSKDKSNLESILGKTERNWFPPPTGLALPRIDWTKLQPPEPPKEKPFLERVWDTVKAYPAIVILLLVLLVGSASKK